MIKWKEELNLKKCTEEQIKENKATHHMNMNNSLNNTLDFVKLDVKPKPIMNRKTEIFSTELQTLLLFLQNSITSSIPKNPK